MTSPDAGSVLARLVRKSPLHPATLVLIVGSSLFIGVTAYLVAFGHQIDWVTYRNATWRWLDGQPIYAPAQLQGPYHLADVVTIGYAYPPPGVVLFLPFALGDWGRWAWLAANVGFFLLGMQALTRRFGGPATTYLWGPLLGLLAVSLPYLDAVTSGSNSLAFAGLFALALAHTLASTVLYHFLPPEITHFMRVGPGFFGTGGS